MSIRLMYFALKILTTHDETKHDFFGGSTNYDFFLQASTRERKILTTGYNNVTPVDASELKVRSSYEEQ